MNISVQQNLGRKNIGLNSNGNKINIRITVNKNIINSRIVHTNRSVVIKVRRAVGTTLRIVNELRNYNVKVIPITNKVIINVNKRIEVLTLLNSLNAIYKNNNSGLSSVNVQGAIDEIKVLLDSKKIAKEFTQSIPSATWVVDHNLGYKPNVSVADSSGDTVGGFDVHYDSLDRLTIRFGASFSGTANMS